MRTLAIECATEACSAALFEDGVLLGGTLEVLGRGHAEWLVPIISDLPDRGRADRILVSLGPGSFTGVRVGLAAARALALAWKAECLGYPTLALVAGMAREQQPGEAVTVCMSGGHGEWFVQDFGVDGSPLNKLVSLTPSDANNRNNSQFLAGSKAGELAILGGTGHVVLDILPDARKTILVPQVLVTTDLAPIYGRVPDAKLPGSRA